MKTIWIHIRVFISSLLILSSCAEIDQPLTSIDKVIKIETKWQCDKNGNREFTVLNKEFDKDGRLIKVTEYDSKGLPTVIRTITYSNLGSNETAQYVNSAGDTDSTKLYCNEINSQGNISKKTEIGVLGDTLAISDYRYDSYGNLIYSKLVSTTSNSITITDYVYNQAGSLAVSIQKNAITGFIQKRDSIVYSPTSPSIDKITMDSNGNFKVIITYIYDKFGKIYKEIENDPNGKIIRTFVYDYIYY